MRASEKLLNLKHHHLEVFRSNDKIGVCYQDADVLEYPCRKSEYGIGHDFEEACENYLNIISGKTLVFGYGKTRKELTIL